MAVTGDYLKNRSARYDEMRAYNQLVQTGNYCVVCGYQGDPHNIEQHHLAGRKHHSSTIPTCKNCHGTLSKKQRYWHSEWLKTNLSPKKQIAFQLQGMSDSLTLTSNSLLPPDDEGRSEVSEITKEMRRLSEKFLRDGGGCA